MFDFSAVPTELYTIKPDRLEKMIVYVDFGFENLPRKWSRSYDFNLVVRMCSAKVDVFRKPDLKTYSGVSEFGVGLLFTCTGGG